MRAAPAIAQLVEHLTVDPCSNQMVPGSIPGGGLYSYWPWGMLFSDPTTERARQSSNWQRPASGTRAAAKVDVFAALCYRQEPPESQCIS